MTVLLNRQLRWLGAAALDSCLSIGFISKVAPTFGSDALTPDRPAQIERRGKFAGRFRGRQVDAAAAVTKILEACNAARLRLVGIDRKGLVMAAARMGDMIDATTERAVVPGIDHFEGQRRMRRD